MITATSSSSPTKRLSLSILPTSSTSTLANRRRNNKNLSLCLSSDNTVKYFQEQPPPTATIKKSLTISEGNDDINAYPSGPVNIMPFLYLGSEKNASDLNHLKELSIGAILNVAAEVNNPFEYMFQPMDDVFQITPSPSLSKASSVSSGASSIQTIQSFDMAYQKLPWEHNQDNLAVELKKAIDIIDRARSARQNILVHCQCGVARSATVIIAYVMKTLKLPMQDAYNHVKQLAPAISPNLGLLFQLREFEQSCIQVQTQVQHPIVVVGRNNSHIDRPKSWIAPTTPAATVTPEPFVKKTPASSGFLLRASSLCLSGAWKRKLTKSTKSIFSSSSSADDDSNNEKVPATPTSSKNDGWWKARKLSIDSPVCC